MRCCDQLYFFKKNITFNVMQVKWVERERWPKGDELGSVFEKNDDGFKWSVLVRMMGLG